MSAAEYRFGFRVLGPATETRRLIDWAAAFRAYAECDNRAECDREAYLSAFTFAGDFAEHLKATGSTAGFAGSCWAPWLWLDVDRDQLADALDAARRLAVAAGERFGIGEDDLLAFFSGSKGFHLGLPTALWQPEPGPLFHRTARRFAERLAELAGVGIDAGVYDRVRLFRAPNSRHPRTGHYKCRLIFGELMGWNIDAIRQRAARPEAFELPEPTGTSADAAAEWAAAADAVQCEAEAKAQRTATGADGGRLNRGTLEFIREGAAVNNRHRLLYSAAANLHDWGAPAGLVHELLTEAALDSGLPPSEVRRCIDNALAGGTVGGAA